MDKTPGENREGESRNEPNKKKPKLSVVTTPPKEGTPMGKNVSVVDLAWDDLEAKSMKRKRIDSPAPMSEPRRESARLQERLKEYIEKVDKEVRELWKRIGEVPNTKREVREQAWQVRSTMSLIMSRQIQGLLGESSLETAAIDEVTPITENGTQTDIPVGTKIMKTIGTQTEETGQRTRRWEMELSEEEIPKIQTNDDYQKVKDKRWPEKAFNKVQITVGNPLAAANEECTLIITDSKDPDMTKYVQKMYKERYTELADMTSSFEVMENITRRKTIDGDIEKTKYVIKITTDGTDHNLWEQMEKVRDYTKEKDVNKIRTHKLLEMDQNNQRKMLQAIFQKEQTVVELFVPNSTQRQQPPRKQAEKKQHVYETEALEIVKKGMDYSEVLKQVKTSLGGTEMTKGIKTIRSTKTGSLLVVLDKDKKDIEALRRTITEKIPQCQIRGYGQKAKEKTKTLFIRNMEATVTKEEIREAICKELKDEEQKTKIEIGDVRPSRNNTATVTVKTTIDLANELLKNKYTQIGMSEGQIEERLDIIKCHRCWGYGHVARECTDIDRRPNCFKCGQTGHKAGDCQEENQCLLCNKKGHTAGGIGCRAKRQALTRARENSTNSTPKKTEQRKETSPKSRQGDDEVFNQTQTQKQTRMEVTDTTNTTK